MQELSVAEIQSVAGGVSATTPAALLTLVGAGVVIGAGIGARVAGPIVTPIGGIIGAVIGGLWAGAIGALVDISVGDGALDAIALNIINGFPGYIGGALGGGGLSA